MDIGQKKAYNEGKLYGDCRIIASSEEDKFLKVPDVSSLKINSDSDYRYYCDNHT